MAFVLKQGDTLPNLPFILWLPGRTGRLDLTGATVNIVVRTAGAAGPLAFKKPCTITDAVNGEGIYDWAPADTVVAGNFEYEFEITWASGDIQTIPADSYFQLVIADDIG